MLKAYIGKNDLIFIIKTDNNNRFGGYAHECFELNYFEKKDLNAFLFNLNKKTIYKSKGGSNSIWRGPFQLLSINFGSGVDLKINHKFLSGKNRVYPSGKDYNYNQVIYPLNENEYFCISFFEIYQVIID